MNRLIPLCVLLISTNVFSQENNPSSASPVGESVADMKAKIERLNTENAQLRAQLQALGAKPKLEVGQAPIALRVIKQLPDLINQIPADKLPAKNAEFWNDLTLQMARDWIDNNLVGRKFQVTANFGSPYPAKDAIIASFSNDDTVVGRLSFIRSDYECAFPIDQASVLSRKKNGELCKIEGTIRRVTLAEGGLKVSNDPRIPTKITVYLKDCKLMDKTRATK